MRTQPSSPHLTAISARRRRWCSEASVDPQDQRGGPRLLALMPVVSPALLHRRLSSAWTGLVSSRSVPTVCQRFRACRPGSAVEACLLNVDLVEHGRSHDQHALSPMAGTKESVGEGLAGLVVRHSPQPSQHDLAVALGAGQHLSDYPDELVVGDVPTAASRDDARA